MSEDARASFEDWKRLDLEPGADERAARAAYARKLKQTRPDVDPEGFQALRESFERVLEEIRAPDPATPTPEAPWGGGPPAEPEPTVDPAAVAAVLHAVSARRRRGDSAGALAALDEALAGALRLDWRHAIEDALLADVAADASVRRDLLRGLADRFDWREATGRHAADERMGPLRERVQSADALEALRERVAAARAGGGPPGDRVLVTLFGPYRPGLFDRALEAEEAAVAEETMAAFFQHADVDGLVDPRMLAAMRAALGAAPMMVEPPPFVAKSSQAEPQPGAIAAEPSVWTERFPRWVVVGAVIFFLNLARHGGFGGAPTERTTPDSAAAYDHVVTMPSLPTSLEVDPRDDGTRVVRLKPLAQANLGRVRAVRIVTEPGAVATEIDKFDLFGDQPSYTLPRDAKSFSVQYLMDDGGHSGVETFDLDKSASPDTPTTDTPKTDTTKTDPSKPEAE